MVMMYDYKTPYPPRPQLPPQPYYYSFLVTVAASAAAFLAFAPLNLTGLSGLTARWDFLIAETRATAS